MLTLDDAWNSYLSTRQLTRNGYLNDISRYRTHLKPYWHGRDLASTRTIDIQNYTTYLCNKSIGPQTIRLCLSQLRRVMKRALLLELYNSPLPFFEMPCFDSVRYRYLTLEEAKNLFLELKNMSEFWYHVATIVLNTGMRSGEIFSLKGKNFNFQQKSLILHETKNKKQRIIPLNQTALEIIEGSVSGYERYLFGQIASPERKYEKVSKVYRRAVAKCGLNDGITDNRYKVVFHTLRHTFASWLVMEATPLAYVAELLGHNSTKVTERYAHLSPDRGHSIVNKIPKL